MRTKKEKADQAERYRKKYQKAYQAQRYMEMKRNPLLTPEADLEDNHAQFVLFLQDCVIPSTQYWVKFSAIYSTYMKYCKALGQKPESSRIQFAKLLANHFIKRMKTNGSYYSCLLKSKIFIQTEDVVDEPEFIINGQEGGSNGIHD